MKCIIAGKRDNSSTWYIGCRQGPEEENIAECQESALVLDKVRIQKQNHGGGGEGGGGGGEHLAMGNKVRQQQESTNEIPTKLRTATAEHEPSSPAASMVS